MPTALPNISVSDGATLTYNYTGLAGGVAKSIVDPQDIGAWNRSRTKVVWSSTSQTRKRNFTGKMELADLAIVAVYYKDEYTELNAAFEANKFVTLVITKPADINNTASSSRTLTLEGQIQNLSFPAMNQETQKLEYNITFIVDSYTLGA